MWPPDSKKIVAVFAIGFCSLSGGDLRAVQVFGTSGTGSIYTTAPSDDFGFENVARVSDTADGFYTSGVYLGNGWMLSAYHEVRNGSGGFSFGPVVLDGTTYSVNATTAVRITDPSTQAPVDLAMYQLTTMPADTNLKTLSVSGSSPAPNSALVLMGNGDNRAATLTKWNVNTSTTPWTWTVTSGRGDLVGYFYDPGQSLRWGTGTLSGTESSNDGFGVTSFFYSTFQNTTGSAMAAVGDSGGGVFFKNGSTWELSGIMLSVGTYSGQPASTSVVGDATYAADLSYYGTQINSIAALRAPGITTQPNSLTLLEGGSGTFTVAASGTPPPGCQWQRMPFGSGTWSNMTDISGTYAGTTMATLKVSNAALEMNGDQFRCVAANGVAPNATSNAATLTVQTGYTAWANPWFGSQAGDPSISGPAAMPQNDGIPNALKYLCDINPATTMTPASRAALPVGGMITVGGTQFLTLTYRQNQNIPGLALSVQTSMDLQTWQTVIPDSSQPIGTDPATGDPIIQIEVRTNGGQELFLRLQITVS